MTNKRDAKGSLDFQKTFTRKKKFVNNDYDSVPLLPTPAVLNKNDDEQIKLFQGVFTGISVDIVDRDDIIRLYEGGCYGKASQSRSVPAAVYTQGNDNNMSDVLNNETLVLNLEEACFLAYFHKTLQIKNLQSEIMEFGKFMTKATQIQPNFVAYMAAYLHLRSKGWIIKSGTKFGGHFLMYKKGPRYYHASYLVYVAINGETSYLQPKNLRGLQRVAESSDKNLLTLEVFLPKTDFLLESITDFQQIKINENVIRRINLNLFVSRNNQTSKRK